MTESLEQWALIIGGLVTALGGAQGLRVLLRRRPRRSMAADVVTLSDATIRWAEKLEEMADRATRRAETAERKADEAEATADAARREAVYIKSQLDQVVSYLDVLLSVIFDDDGTETDAEHMARIRATARRRPNLQTRSAET